MTPRISAPVLRALAVIGVALLLMSACGDDDDGSVADREASTTRPTGSTTTSNSDDERTSEVVAAYEAASRAFIDAAAIPDPNFAALAETHTGPMLEQRRDVLLALQADGRIIRYPEPSQYQIKVSDVEIDGDVARLEVCVVDDGERVVVATGEVVAGGLGTVQVRAAMRQVETTWRLEERVQEAEWEGVAGCAAD